MTASEEYAAICEENEIIKNLDTDDFNPVIEFADYPITIFDKIEEAINNNNYSKFYSYTAWDYHLKQFVMHTYSWTNTKMLGFRIKEVRRDFETLPSVYRDMYYTDYGCSSGCHIIWRKLKATWTRGECEPNKQWIALPDWYYTRMGRALRCEINSIENIIASDMSLRYFGYQENYEVSLLEYIRLYRKYPIVETFMKLGLYRFITNPKAIDLASKDKSFRKWINGHANELQGMAFTTARNAWKKNPNGDASSYYRSLMYRIECGRELAHHDREIYEYALKFATQEKMYSYIQDIGIKASSYYDYLTACQWLQLDFNDTKVMFPKDYETFYAFHDEYTKQYADWKSEQELKKAEKESKEISSKMLQTALKFGFCEYSDKEYTVITAKSKMELIHEGSKKCLDHCVGRMNYDKKQAEGRSIICFLRKTSDVDTPLVTIEVDCNCLAVLQCYGKKDTRPQQEVLDWVNVWQQGLKKAQKAYKQI